MAAQSNHVSVTGTGSFNLDQDMYDGEEDYATDFAVDAEQFAKALDTISNFDDTRAAKRTEILKLVNTYYEISLKKLDGARYSQRRRSGARQRSSEDRFSQDSMDVDQADGGAQDLSDEELATLEREVQTWDLLRRLLPLRYPERKIAQPKREEPSKYSTNAELWEEFLQSDVTAQERKEILEVLQITADDTRDDIDDMVRDLQQNAERGDIIAYGWLHTRSAIKMQKSVNGWTGSLDPNSQNVTDSTGANSLVTQLDPDVITRQGRKLQPQDEYFERAIWLGCYELLRRGRSVAEIRDWCVERTEVWRAMSMSAMPLSKHSEDKDANPNTLALLLWRRTCYALARQGGTDDYERAVYGILSGDVKTVSPVCKSWDDHVFTQVNALLRSQFDAFVQKRLPHDATQAVGQLQVFDAVHAHGDAGTVSEAWLGTLETSPTTTDEARVPIKSLQSAIISNTVDQYIENEGLVLGKQANQHEPSRLIPASNKSRSNIDSDKYFSLADQNGLRILVHVYLLLASLDDLQDGEIDAESRRTQENALAAYISALRLNSMVELLPLYCSKLQGERAFYTLSRNVSKVVDGEDRKMLLRIMEKLGMDIAEFVVFQPHSLLKENPEDSRAPIRADLKLFTDEPPTVRFGRRLVPDFLGEVPDELESTDEQLIQSLEWMLLVDGLWDETFAVGVAIYKRFLKSYNLQAALALSRRVTCADIFRIKAGIPVQDDTNPMWFSEAIEANEFVDEEGQQRQLTVARNFLDLESLMRALDSMETVGATADLQLDPTFERTAEFLPTLGGHVNYVKAYMTPVLHGWLLERIEDDADFDLLREMYLPEVILGYVSVLHYGGTTLSRDNLLEAMELAALIAEKDSDVAGVMMKSDRMTELVQAFANCSKALAINSEDKRRTGSASNKKFREMGWSKELWSIKNP
ncbi:nuclear pore protein 84/107 [Truncatella angustata]|uniref:Nuclear pore complex protein n=1 Tax=Truncatella angustata TaxID=152316 RepID=A0A9P8UY93_9PEZI|nr:nuclear pore protein 84/107 [Truncatella angustata]KAH6660231.1 nuclear pore protein 84/107 [Truncatella angustata]